MDKITYYEDYWWCPQDHQEDTPECLSDFINEYELQGLKIAFMFQEIFKNDKGHDTPAYRIIFERPQQ